MALVETLLLVVAEVLILSVVGVAALAPVTPEVRARLLPAAPIFGAALIAAITNWTARWLSIRWSIPVIVLIGVALLVGSHRAGRRPLQLPFRRTLVALGLVTAVSAGGLALAVAPTVAVGDTNAVSPAYTVDGLYFAGVSTWMVDHPLLPGPADDGSELPATNPAGDTVRHHLRFGQSATAAVLSVVLFRSPYATVGSVSLLWLLMLGASAYLAGTLLGMRRGWALGAAFLATGGYFVIAQPLQGQNDGLLGNSLALLALALSVLVVHDRRYSWALALIGAGLVASYSEYLVLVAPAILAFAVLGPWRSLLHRLNSIAGPWAATGLLVPFGFVWLAASFKTTSRATDGPTPFLAKVDGPLVRAYAGLPSMPQSPHATGFLVVSVVVLVALLLGLLFAVLWTEVRGLALGVAAVVALVEWHASRTGASNLQFRTWQLGLPLLIVLAVLGWQALARRRPALPRMPRLAWSRSVAGVAMVLGVLFVAGNLLAVGASTSFARARTQHVPTAVSDAVLGLVQRVGAQNVTVVTPTLVDNSSLSLILADYPQVQFPITHNLTYDGSAPHWDGQPDPYYVVGPGASVSGGATVLEAVDGFSIVQLHSDGMILAPLDASWPRVTWMRGYPCAVNGVPLLLIRGGLDRTSFRIASGLSRPVRNPLNLRDQAGHRLTRVGRPRREDGWSVQYFRAPQAMNQVLVVRSTPQLEISRIDRFPVLLGMEPIAAEQTQAQQRLLSFCYANPGFGLDGYDRDITLGWSEL